MRCLAYALGGGRGHQTRARHIHRALRTFEPGLHTVLLVPEDRVGQDEPGLLVREAPSAEREELATWVAHTAREWQPQLLWVDTFPRGILGELAELHPPCPSALVTRWVEPNFYRHPPVREALQRFDTVLWTEPKSDHDFPGEVLPPIVDERPHLPRAEARGALECDGRSLIFVFPWTSPCWTEAWSKLQRASQLREWDLRLIHPELDGRYQRVDLYLSAADLVVSPCGYHTYYEVSKHGLPAVWVPQPRKYDNQRLRAEGRLGHAGTSAHLICPEGPSPNEVEEMLQQSPTRLNLPSGNRAIAQRLLDLVGARR